MTMGTNKTIAFFKMSLLIAKVVQQTQVWKETSCGRAIIIDVGGSKSDLRMTIVEWDYRRTNANLEHAFFVTGQQDSSHHFDGDSALFHKIVMKVLETISIS